MTTNKPMDSYDEIKGMLYRVRKIQMIAEANKYGLIQEQVAPADDPYHGVKPIKANLPTSGVSREQERQYHAAKYAKEHPGEESNSTEEGEDLMVINNVEVEIHSEDPEDLQLSDEEKNKISQLIDDFRAEVSEIAEFDKLHVYDDNAKLEGRIGDIGLNFTLSTGNDTGLYVSNTSLLKIDDNSLGIIVKLRGFEQKFSNSINDLLVNRSTT